MSHDVAPASEPLRRFLQVARGAGLRVSAAEGIDAARAVDLVGFSDRTVLKDTLGLLLAKTPEEKAAFDEVFNLYFKRDEFDGENAGTEDAFQHPNRIRFPAHPTEPAARALAARVGDPWDRCFLRTTEPLWLRR